MALPVEVVRSAKRRKTVSAEIIDGVVRVRVPSWMDAAEIDRQVAELVPRLERRFRSDHVDLADRARQLARRFGLPEPRSVEWSDNQQRQWGSCQVTSGEIRVSRRLADYPSWVLDYVLVHELAHLVHADHSPPFRALVDRYPRAERARGFLIAVDLGPTPDPARDPIERADPELDDPADIDEPIELDDPIDLDAPWAAGEPVRDPVSDPGPAPQTLF